jgi:uncharacterized protein (TIGR03118 family)
LISVADVILISLSEDGMRRFLLLSLLGSSILGSSILRANPATFAIQPIATAQTDPSQLSMYTAGGIDMVRDSWVLGPNGEVPLSDPNLPLGYTVRDVQSYNGVLYVSYGFQTAGQGSVGAGAIDTFDMNGNLLTRLATGGTLFAPEGITIAPSGFADIAGDVLVANAGNGTISVFNANNGGFIELLHDQAGNVISIDGLWGVQFGKSDPLTNRFFFTASPSSPAGTTLGQLVVSAAPPPINTTGATGTTGGTGLPEVPEPSTWILAAGGLALTILYKRYSRRRVPSA